MFSRPSTPRPASPSGEARRSGKESPQLLPRWGVATIVATIAILMLATIGAISVFFTGWTRQLAATAPGVGTIVIAPEESKAARALGSLPAGSEDADATAYLAAQPTAYWLTPEIDPVGEVGARTQNLIAEARAAGRALSIVVYGLPERDCSAGLSAGGLDDTAYRQWIGEIAVALESAPDLQKIVILEPDSLALAPECGNVAARTTQLHDAALRLASTDTWIYVDGGHSHWLPVSEMAGLINGLDLAGTIRGFATNVSNYNDTYSEFDYAHQLSAATGGLHAVIDTSRNGAGSNGEWCNPPGRLIGDPGGTYGDDVVDTNLWIKPPGESDGTCNGGPVAGAWWPHAAVELTRDVPRAVE